MSALAEALVAAHQRTGCPICGAKTEAVVIVQLQERRPPRKSEARSVTLCGEHAAQVYGWSLAPVESAKRGYLH